MTYRRLGRSGIQVSVLSFGSWVTFKGQVDKDAAAEMLQTARDAGVNFFDNAEAYGGGASEQIMGDAIAELGWARETYVVSTKLFWGLTEGVNPMGGTHIRWIEIGDGRRFHVQAGDISKLHVERQTHFALSATDFDAVLVRFRAENIAFTDMAGTPGTINTRPDGMRAVFLRDPNGYWFEVNDFKS